MELRFDKKATKSLVEKYYKEYEDFDGKFDSRCSVQCVGYGAAEHDDCVVSMKISGILSVLGQKIAMTRDVTEQEIVNVFSTLLGNEGYSVNSVSLDSGCRSSYEGIGMYEQRVNKPYFNGVVVNVKEKQLIK